MQPPAPDVRKQSESSSAQPSGLSHRASGQIILCGCGCAWKVTRTEVPAVLTEYMTCLCGKTLMQWTEAADYTFEPLEPEPCGDHLV